MIRIDTKRATSTSGYRAWIGFFAAIGFVSIWAAWIVGTRHAVTHGLDPYALGLLRFAVPAVLFAPIWMRTGLKPRSVSWLMLAALMGAGAPFFITVAAAMRSVPAAEVGPLLTGSMPVSVALLAAICFKERLIRARLVGFGCIALGIITISARDLLAGGGAWQGHALLVSGAAMWAVYTIAFKRSGLSALDAAGLVSIWSAILLAPLGIPDLIANGQAGFGSDMIIQALVQGVLSGVVAIIAYGTAVKHLGASSGAAFVALVPGMASVIGIFTLSEWPTATSSAGIGLTTLGVLLASGAFAWRPWIIYKGPVKSIISPGLKA
jgi:drug/metabolite transporter (DMT)-like permease